MLDIIGHEALRQYFSNAIKSGTLSHAHLIVGEDGIGKSLLAKEFAVKILGKHELKQYIDIMEFRNGKNKKSIGVNEIRGIIEEINKKPYEGDRKVIIIYDGDKLTIQAQNAFLKTIEEPPRGVFILILCENSELILDTIKSRCQIHKCNRLKVSEMKSFIYRKYPSISDAEADTLLAFAHGIPGRSEHFMENEDFKVIRNTTAQLMIDINTIDEWQLQKYSDFFVKHKDMADEVLSILLSFIRDVLIYKDTGKKELIVNKDKLETIMECANSYSYNNLDLIIKSIDETRKNLGSNVNPNLVFDVMLFNMVSS